jgi:hypothetical protein
VVIAKRKALLTFTFFLLPSSAGALMNPHGHETPTTSTETVRAESPSVAGFSSYFSGLAGAAIFKGQTWVDLGLRCDLPGNFSVAWRGMLPQSVSGVSQDSYPAFNGLFNTDHVASFGETDWTVLYQPLKIDRYALNLGAGLSLAAVTDHSDRLTNVNGTPEPSSSDTHKTLISPLVQVGVSATLTEWLSVCLDGAWVSYANHDNPYGPMFNLGFRGIMIRPSLQVRF